MGRTARSKSSSESRIRRFAAAAVTAAAAAIACSSPSAPPQPSATVAPIASSAGRFVGSPACRDCHAAEFAAWQTSFHRRTLRPWVDAGGAHFAGADIAPPYSLAADGAASGPGPDGVQIRGRAVFVVGGRHREDVLVRLDDGRVQVFPIAFDVDAAHPFEPLRELAGGTPPPSDVVDFWTRAGRNSDLSCYGCHATGQILTVAGVSPEGLALPASRWSEPGVGCEACHGPGGTHVDAARAKKPSRNEIRLAPGTAAGVGIDTCAACHGLRDVLPSPFASFPAHRYGEPVTAAADPVLSVASNFEFRDPLFANLRPATYQQEAIALGQSGCARAGLTCSACHDVHRGGLTAAMTATDGGDAICAACHGPIVATGSRHALHPAGTPGGRCLDCHMPAVIRGPGRGAARDHTLAPPVAPAGQVPDACASCHAGGSHAAAVAAAWSRIPRGTAASRRIRLGDAMSGALEGRYEAAETLAAIARDATGTSWFLRWAAIERLGQTERAPAPEALVGAVRGALDDPNPALRRAAARALGRMGGPQEMDRLARATGDPDPWVAVEAAVGMSSFGTASSAPRFAQVLRRPDLVADARAQAAFGHARLVASDGPGAETALRRALDLNPMMVGAINDLGLALMAEGKRDDALAAWRRALAINPRYAAARDNLDAISRGHP